MAVTYQQILDVNWLKGAELFINKIKVVTIITGGGGSIVGANAALSLLGP